MGRVAGRQRWSQWEQADAERTASGSGGQTTQDRSVMSGTRVFIWRTMGSHRRFLSKGGLWSTLILSPPSGNSRSGTGNTFDRWGT